jgi:hypothetical protein
MLQTKLPEHAAAMVDDQCDWAFVGVYKVNIQCLSVARSKYRVWVTAGGFQVEGLEHTYDTPARALRAFANAQVMLAEAPALGAQPAPTATEPELPEPALKVLLAGIVAEGGVVDSLGGLPPEAFRIPWDQKLVEPADGTSIYQQTHGLGRRVTSVRVTAQLTEKGAARAVRELARLAARTDGPSVDRYVRVTRFMSDTRAAQASAARELVLV